MREHEVIGMDRGKLKSPPFQVLRGDLLEPEALESVIEAAAPEGIVNCAALANLDVCEQVPDQAKALNTDVPGELARICAAKSIKLVHISTDAVFDGTKTDPYTEEDQPNPLGVYSQTKLDGEQAVQAMNPQATIARVNFFGWSLSGRHSLGEFFVNHLSAGNPVNGFTDVVFCPIFVGHTARLLLSLLGNSSCGLYHVVGPQAISKYQFGVEVARRFGLDESLIQPRSVAGSGLTARRSPHLWLSTHKLSTDLGREIPTFSTGLAEFYTQFQQGYPQKIRSYQQS
jgi:dTDP-4-dehydrorhamnose reductase